MVERKNWLFKKRWSYDNRTFSFVEALSECFKESGDWDSRGVEGRITDSERQIDKLLQHLPSLFTILLTENVADVDDALLAFFSSCGLERYEV